MRKICLTLFFAALFVNMMADEKPISFSQLPKNSQVIITKHFEGLDVVSVYLEKRASLVQYDVTMSNGDKIQFNSNGKWSEIKCKDRAVPDIFIPEKIKTIISQSFEGYWVREIEHDDKLYDIVLNNKWELTFNNSYRLIDIDK